MLTISQAPSSFAPPRFGTARNYDNATLGPQVGEVARRLGFVLMEWQQHVVDVALEVIEDRDSPSGFGLVYPMAVLTGPRQNGKTAIVLSKLIHRAKATTVFGGPQRMLYTAQDRNEARKKWLDDHVARLERARSFRGQFKISKANGAEGIRWRNGSFHGICAPTDTAAHGDTLDEGVIDEAFAHQTDDVEQGMSPAMITRRNKQFFVLSTAGDESSFYFWRQVVTGRALTSSEGVAPLCYFEWSAPEDADIESPDVWRACNPAFGVTITEAALRSEFRRLSAKGPEGIKQFRRAHLNQWVEIPMLEESTPLVIPIEVWTRWIDEQLADTNPDPKPTPMLDPVALAIDASPELASVAISAAGYRPDGLPQVECIEHRPGSEWATAVLLELVRKHKPSAVLIDPNGPAGSLVPDLERAGIELTKVSAGDHARATGAFVDRATKGTLRHLGQPEMTVALQGARKRPMGEAFAWTRRDTSADVCPLISCTLALWGLLSAPPPKPKPVFGPSKKPDTSNEVFRPTSRLKI